MDRELNKRFGKAVATIRRQRGLSQESLDGAVHRTYLSEIERGLKSPTLTTITKLASALDVRPGFLVELATVAGDLGSGADRSLRRGLTYLFADKRPASAVRFTSARASVTWTLNPQKILASTTAANRTIEILADVATATGVDLFALLGLRNLSAFVGEVFASEVSKQYPDMLRANPHQDGYPDLMASTPEGAAYIAERERNGQMSTKKYWSPFPHGGVEVKATCGNTPPARKVPKPRIGESRVPLLVSAEWKAHHRDTNNLLAIFWDFVDGLPTVLAAFFRNDLTPSDWGNVVVPKPGGGRTTSVSIMTRRGVKRMGEGWLILPTGLQHRTRLCQPNVFDIAENCIVSVCSSPTKG